ncbi:hypothetical protein AB0E88_02855 [Streptomyces sp. NPDC028635]|uniref:hypothetical protein n=1 Tax=Streptomyces sp. NPDC028635 TaxID=3154800 RepID=UPI003400C6F0
MGSLKVTVCAGVAVLAALTPAAYAADGGAVSVSPASPAPGADVSLSAHGCAARTATAVSPAFVADAHLAGAEGTLIGESKIRSSAAPGTYDVKVGCAGRTVAGKVTVVERGGHTAPPAHEPPASAPASPIAPVHAGGGGTARLTAERTARIAAADAHAEGPGLAQAVTGLVLAGVAAAAVGVRGVARRSRGTH